MCRKQKYVKARGLVTDNDVYIDQSERKAKVGGQPLVMWGIRRRSRLYRFGAVRFFLRHTCQMAQPIVIGLMRVWTVKWSCTPRESS